MSAQLFQCINSGSRYKKKLLRSSKSSLWLCEEQCQNFHFYVYSLFKPLTCTNQLNQAMFKYPQKPIVTLQVKLFCPQSHANTAP